ncbi:MAG: RNA polymerase sigma factor [Bacteroidetes bacterium]|nr:RNA polymerase sigma factor [Bacteroidota bacterium]
MINTIQSSSPEKLMTAYESILRSFAIKLTKSKNESDDLLQETYYRALVNWERFTDGTNMKAWLLTIMRNIFINNYRRIKNGYVHATATEKQFDFSMARRTDNNASINTFISDDLAKAMKGVSKDFTEPFLLYHQGFQYQEISEMMNLPLGTVKSRIFFARREMKERLAEMGIHNASYN